MNVAVVPMGDYERSLRARYQQITRRINVAGDTVAARKRQRDELLELERIETAKNDLWNSYKIAAANRGHRLVKGEVRTIAIKKIVAHRHGLLVRYLDSSSRDRRYALARMEYFYQADRMTSETLQKIGDDCGGRDKKTVIHGIAEYKRLMGKKRGYAVRAKQKDAYIDWSLVL